MTIWRVTVPADAVSNGNISFIDCPFDIGKYVGGTNETERPSESLRVHFDKSTTADMWIYGKGSAGTAKHILTNNGRSEVRKFFEANGIDGSTSVLLEIEEISPGELAIRKA